MKCLTCGEHMKTIDDATEKEWFNPSPLISLDIMICEKCNSMAEVFRNSKGWKYKVIWTR